MLEVRASARGGRLPATVIFEREWQVVGILIGVLIAALVYLILAALTGNTLVAAVGAILVLIAAIPTGGFGLGSRFGGRGDRL